MKNAIEPTFIKSYFQLKLFIEIKKLSYEHIDIILKLRCGNLCIVEIEKKINWKIDHFN